MDQQRNWSETVEDLVASGNVDSAITLLEGVVNRLEDDETNNLALASALEELAKLYSSKNLSLKSDDLFSRSALLKLRAVHISTPSSDATEPLTQSNEGVQSIEPHENAEEEDWEAIADRSPVEFKVPNNVPAVSSAVSEQSSEITRRRGRGTFSYKKDELYSDKINDLASFEQEDDDSTKKHDEDDLKASHCNTQHVVVLSDFPPSIKTADIEKLFVDFQAAVRWVDDTTSLVVLRTPSLANEALQKVCFPFKGRILDNNDPLAGRISAKDLEAPKIRPKTSARTAQRLIAQGIGLKIKDPSFGPGERRAQEEDRRRRIVARQKLIEDAWGSE